MNLIDLQKKTRVLNFGGLRAETNTTDNGEGWSITTMKRNNGKTITTAIKGEFFDKSFHYEMFGSEKITLNEIDTPRLTESRIKEIHTEALILFLEKEEIKKFFSSDPESKPTGPQVGQRVFLDGYGKGKFDGNQIIYKIENGKFGKTYLTVDTDTLELEKINSLKNYSKKFGIGTYYIEGDVYKGTPEELQTIVTKAKELQEKKHNEKLIKEQQQKKLIEEQTEAGRNLLKIPVSAKAIIIAEKYVNESDAMTDYFNTSVEDFVLLGFSESERNNINELRFFAKNFEKTKIFHDEVNPEHEHTKESGYYLPQYFLGTSSWSGWKVVKRKLTQIQKDTLFLKAGQNKSYIIEGEFYNNNSNTQEAPEEFKTEKGEIKIIDYSDKAIAVIGETRPIKDKLKDLGGKFNFRLSCGAGWIFPKSKLSEVQSIFNS